MATSYADQHVVYPVVFSKTDAGTKCLPALRSHHIHPSMTATMYQGLPLQPCCLGYQHVTHGQHPCTTHMDTHLALQRFPKHCSPPDIPALHLHFFCCVLVCSGCYVVYGRGRRCQLCGLHRPTSHHSTAVFCYVISYVLLACLGCNKSGISGNDQSCQSRFCCEAPLSGASPAS